MGRNFAENKCVEFLRTVRWPDGIKCPRCNDKYIIEVGYLRTFPEHKRYYCYSCRYTFSDTCMTVFHGSRLSLNKWFNAIILWTRGSSAMAIKNKLNVTYKTAWRIKHLLKGDSIVREIRQRLPKSERGLLIKKQTILPSA